MIYLLALVAGFVLGLVWDAKIKPKLIAWVNTLGNK